MLDADGVGGGGCEEGTKKRTVPDARAMSLSCKRSFRNHQHAGYLALLHTHSKDLHFARESS